MLIFIKKTQVRKLWFFQINNFLLLGGSSEKAVAIEIAVGYHFTFLFVIGGRCQEGGAVGTDHLGIVRYLNLDCQLFFQQFMDAGI